MNPIEMLGLLLVCHALADYPLQGDFLAKAKNEAAPIPGVPWWQAMGAHCLIHAGAAGMVTGSVLLGALEGFAHWTIDRAKCQGSLTFNEDQGLHVGLKVVWVAIAFVFPGLP